MRAIAGGAERGPFISGALVASAVAVLALTVFTGFKVAEIGTIVGLTVVAAVWYRTLLRWEFLLGLTILLILFVPIKRYEMPGNLPFDLEPYRMLVALVVAGWFTALLTDRRVRARASGFEAPMALIAASALASVIANPGRVSGMGMDSEVLKGLTFLLSYILVFYVIVSVVRSHEQIDKLLKVTVAGGAVVAFFALVEARTGFNPFQQLAGVVPLLRLRPEVAEDLALGNVLERGGRLRVWGSAQGPIALGAALMVLVPFAIYLARRSLRNPWWIAVLLLVLGALATRSRTGVVMAIVIAITFLWLRPAQTRRFWPALLPALVAVHLLLPGTIGILRASFFPAGGLVAQQSDNAGTRGSGRIADLDPALAEWSSSPVFGQGYNTRQTGRDSPKDLILDNQWLKTLLETGALGFAAWVWLFVRFVRRTGREAKGDLSERGWLLAAMAAAAASFAVGMFLYDAFAFIQVTIMLFILMGLGAALLRLQPSEAPEAEPTRVRRRRSRVQPQSA
jgi:polysaccharide biosynthesis protein PslJ